MMELITWTATGLGVGWLVRTAMRSRRDFGLLGDLTMGWLGGVVGGWVFRSLGVTAPDNRLVHIVVALVGATGLLLGVRLLRQLMFAGRAGHATAAPAPASDFEELVRGISQLERRIISGLLTRQHSVPDPNKTFEAEATFGQRVADKVALFGGSWTFIGLFFIGMVSWMAVNQESTRAFDPYPFILLNLVLSCLAALQAPVIMMSQNRQSAKDRSDARTDYEVNVRAEMHIVALHAKVDALRDVELARLLRLVETQQRTIALLQRQDGADDGPAGSPAPGDGEGR